MTNSCFRAVPALLLVLLGPVLSAHADLQPVGPGGVVTKTAIDCATFSRLPCAGGQISRAGILYSAGRRAWVAVLPSLSDAEHAATPATFLEIDGREISLRYVRSDFATNVDLYEPASSSESAALATLPEIATKSKFDPTAVHVLTGRSLTAKRAIKLIASDSDRTFLPLIRSVFEVLDSRADSIASWSATSVFSAEGAFVGVVADEFLELRPGLPTRLVRYAELAEARVAHAVVVPEAEIRRSAQRLSEGGLPFIRRVDSQCYLASGVLTCEVCDTKPEGERPSSTAFPIGGANGSGVGGVLTSGRRCKMRFAPGDTSRTARLDDDGRKWFGRLRSEGDLSRSEAWYSVNTLGSVWILTSASEFFRSAIDPASGAKPILTYVRNPYAKTNPLHAIYEVSEQVANQAFTRLGDPRGASGEHVFNFIAQIYTRARILQSYRPQLQEEYPFLATLRDSRETQWWLVTNGSSSGSTLHEEFKKCVDLVEKAQ
jgi:hypothetical protein